MRLSIAGHRDTSREETCLSCLNALRGILRAKYAHTGEETVDQILMILNYQPLFIGQVYTTVSSVGDNQGNVVEGAEALNGFEPLRGKVLLVMDKEGIYLYESSMLVPKYRLMFWSIANPDSIERVKLTCDPTTQANRISLFTRTHSFELVTDRTLVDHIENTRPIKQHLLRDVEILVSSLRELQPRRGVEASGDQPPRPHQYQASSITPVRHQWEYQADKYVADRNEATKLDGELQSALDQFVGNEETEMMWLALAFDLEEIQSDGKIPLSDHRSGVIE
ncbi:hypothetical protein MAR_024533 [Mya arenaria]|uniref:Uncharacterized protein n=1 Tax=Mya arenaria TaxID=6604 RepID=A0ABY7DZ24_MYAAR|nr:hypothetical protein MAR_024533 [Mya arenaria]